jgi:hypothetical protein
VKQCALTVGLIPRTRERQIGGENVIHTITPLDIRDPKETHTEQRGHHQQHRAERHFQSDQPFT